MEGVPIEIYREILKHLDATDLCLCATVNKQWCYEVNSSILWRDLFLKNYAPEKVAKPKNASAIQAETELNNLVRTTLVPHIYNDWKRAYICKIVNAASESRILCLSRCFTASLPQTPLLDNHGLTGFAHQPLMFEQFATKVVEYIEPPSKYPQREKQDTDDPDPSPGLFQQIRQTLGNDLNRAWMLVNAAKIDGLTQMLSKETNAIFTTLMGSFFNLTNVNNFPYLVKVSSCLTFCEHVYDMSGGNWCYVIVEHPSLQSHIGDVWYLNIDANLYPNKEIKTMAILRRHFMKCYTWYKDFFRFYEPQTFLMMMHIYDHNNRDELFLLDSTTKTPIVEYFIIIDADKKLFSEKIAVIRREFEPKKINLNGEKGDLAVVTEYVKMDFLWRAQDSLKQYFHFIPALRPDADLIPQLKILKAQANSYGITSEQHLVMYFSFYYRDPTFAENVFVKDILESDEHNNATRIRLIDDILTEQEKEADRKRSEETQQNKANKE